MNDSTIAIGEPKRFRLSQILIATAIGLLPAVPSGLALGVGVGSLIGGIMLASAKWLAVGVIALIVFGVSLFFIPLLWANPYICYLVRKGTVPSAEEASTVFLVQLALHPRLHLGIRGWLEDADDIGYLTVSSTGISFTGDHVTLRLPSESIVIVRTRNIGFRGFWICGHRIYLTSSLLGDRDCVEFGDRAAFTTLGCAQNTKSIVQKIRSVTKPGRFNKTSDGNTPPTAVLPKPSI